MTKDEFKAIVDPSCDAIAKKYGSMMYHIMSDVVRMNNLVDQLADLGFTFEHKRYKESPLNGHKEVSYQGKVVANITNVGPYTSLEFLPRKKTLARMVLKKRGDFFTVPIKGIHRVLDWHEVEDKMHILARGEVFLHVHAYPLSQKSIDKFMSKDGMKKLARKMKRRERLFWLFGK